MTIAGNDRREAAQDTNEKNVKNCKNEPQGTSFTLLVSVPAR